MHDLSISCAYFHFVQQVARYEATYPSHEHIFPFRATSCTLRGDLSISCAYFHFVQQVARYEVTYPSHERVFIRATSYTLLGDLSPMRVFSFRATSCTLQGNLSLSWAYFHFVQQVARYEATYPSHERIFISCNKLHATGDSVVNIVYLWWKFPAPSLFLR